MAGAVSLGVIEEIAGMVDLIVSQVFEGRGAVDDSGGDVVVGICVG